MQAGIAFATLFLVVALSQPIYAAECIPQDQLTEEDKYVGKLKDKCVIDIQRKGTYSVAELQDETVVIYKGVEPINNRVVPNHIPHLKNPQFDCRDCDDNYTVQLREQKLNHEEISKALAHALKTRLLSSDDGELDFSTTDDLFFELLDVIKKSDWTKKYPLSGDALDIFSKYAVDYGKRYSFPVIDTLYKLFAENPSNGDLQNALNWSIEYTFSSKRAPAEELPTAEERKLIGMKLFELMTEYPGRFHLHSSGATVIKLIDPELAQRIENLEKAQREGN